jgi:hypothetical protein
MAATQGGRPLLKAILPTCVLRRRGLFTNALKGPPPTTRGLGPTRHVSWPRTEEAKPPRAERVTAQRLQAFLHFRQTSGWKDGPPCGRHATAPRGRTLSTSTHPAWRPRPTRHVTSTPVTTCEKLHRHLRQYRAFSTAEPAPQLEATLRIAQQCQPSASITGQSAAGEGATVDMARSGPTVMAAAGERKRRSNSLQAHVPSWGSRRALPHGVKTTRPCSVPRTAHATAAPRTTRPVALTPRQGRRHLWQAKRATLHLRHDDHVGKGAPHRSISYPFPLPLSLLLQGPGKGILQTGSFSAKEASPEPSYRSEVRRLAPRKGSTAASEHSGSAPTTGQRFEGWPLGRVRQPP